MFVLYGGEVWCKEWFDKQCFSHCLLREELINAEEAAHFENDRREEQRREKEQQEGYW